MMRRFNSRNFKSLLPWFFLALAIMGSWHAMAHLGAFFGGVGILWGIITPFFYGFLLAYIINIPAEGIQKLLEKTNVGFIVKRRRLLSILLALILLVLLLVLILNLVIPAIVHSITLFISNFPTHYENALGAIAYINNLDILGFRIDLEEILAGLQAQVQNFSLDNLVSPINTIFAVSGAIFGGLFRVFLTIVSSIYILVEKEKFKAFSRRMLQAFSPVRVYETFMKYTLNLNYNFKRYLYTQTIDGLILGTLATIVLMILGSPYALVLGLMLGILNYIPYFGSIFATAIAVLVVAFTQGLTTGTLALVLLFVLQQMDANIIQPRLMGGSFKMSPLLIIISITIGGAFAGILGMIAAIPIVSVLKDILENIIAYYERKKAPSEEGEDV